MLFVIVISFKAHKVKEQEIKRKTFSLNRKGNTLYTLTECHYQKNKKTKLRENPKCSTLAFGGGGSSFWLD